MSWAPVAVSSDELIDRNNVTVTSGKASVADDSQRIPSLHASHGKEHGLKYARRDELYYAEQDCVQCPLVTLVAAPVD